MKPILVVSAGLVHPTPFCRRALKKVLSGMKGLSFTFTSDINVLASLKQDLYSSVILYFQKSRISDRALESLEGFVFNGGGVMAIHSASASFKQSERYYNLIGGKFVSHGKIEDFKVKPLKKPSGIYKGISDFSVFDELYLHKYKEDVTVHFYTEVNDRKEPVVWTRELGKGKIAYCSLGHCSPVFNVSQVKQIIRHSIRWINTQ